MSKNKLFLVLLTFAALISSCSVDPEFPCHDMKSYQIGVTTAERKVKVLFQVLDCDGNGVTSLDDNSFIILENNKEIGLENKANFKSSQIPFKIKTLLLLDISSSVETLLPDIKKACNDLIDNKLANQQIAIYVFDKNTRMLQNFTNNSSLLKSAVNSIGTSPLESSTNLFGALQDVEGKWTNHYGIDSIVDGSLILFTDGRHNANPDLTLDMAKAAVKNTQIVIAALKSKDLEVEPLKSIASASKQGSYLEAQNAAELNSTFVLAQKKVLALANSIYYLTYTSTITSSKDRDNTLEIQLKDAGGKQSIVLHFNSAGFQ